MIVFRFAVIIAATLTLGSMAIILGLLIPGGVTFIPLARIWSWLILKTCGIVTTATYDARLDPSRPAVYMANHQSQFDVPALVLAMPTKFRIVAKRELLYVPIFGWALWLAGFIFIDRADRQKAVRSLDRAAKKIQQGTSIVLFAEGTRSADGRLLPFKKGGFVMALQSGAPIVPVSIRGGHQVLPKGTLRVRPGRIDVVMGEPIETSSYSLDSKDVLIDSVRRKITDGLAPPHPSAGDLGLID